MPPKGGSFRRIQDEIGVARYDIDVCAYRKISLEGAAEEAYKKLEQPDEMIEAEIAAQSAVNGTDFCGFSPDAYRLAIAKNLKYMEQCGTARIDWERVWKCLPSANSVNFDIEKGNDVPFGPSIMDILIYRFLSRPS